jgi:Na+/melibiose symporter-like transporter
MFDKLTQHLKGKISFIFLILPLVLSLRGWQIYRTEKLDTAAAAILRAAIRQTPYDKFLVAPDTL